NSSALTVNGVLDLNRYSTSVGSIAGLNTGVITSSSAGVLTLTVGGNNLTTSYYGVINDGSGTVSLAKVGGGNLSLFGANTYSGSTTINDGTLTAGIVSVPGTSGAFGLNSAVILANTAGAILDLNNNNTQIGSLATGGSTGGNVNLGSATLTIAGTAINTSYAGVIYGTGGVTLNATGTQTFAGANTYGGSTTINAGTLTVTSSGSLGGSSGVTTTALTITSATLDLQRALTVGSLSMSGTYPTITNTTGTSSLIVSGTSTLANSITTSGNQTYTGAVTLGADTTLTTGSSLGAILFSSTVTGANTLSTTTTGATTFSGAIGATPLTGLTISTGTLTAGAITLATTGTPALSITNSGAG
ncbi:MAG: hypothetical protein EBS66_20435, partial [Betaproteobacteria bacterium]|nr:hypothetical protein [Betaproteobacteria bacterium]